MKPSAAYRRREQQLKPTKPELHTQNPKQQQQHQQHQQSINLCSLQPADQSPRKKKESKKAIDHISVALVHKCTTTATKCKCKSSMVL